MMTMIHDVFVQSADMSEDVMMDASMWIGGQMKGRQFSPWYR
jgi:hypothetical protein